MSRPWQLNLQAMFLSDFNKLSENNLSPTLFFPLCPFCAQFLTSLWSFLFWYEHDLGRLHFVTSFWTVSAVKEDCLGNLSWFCFTICEMGIKTWHRWVKLNKQWLKAWPFTLRFFCFFFNLRCLNRPVIHLQFTDSSGADCSIIRLQPCSCTQTHSYLKKATGLLC